MSLHPVFAPWANWLLFRSNCLQVSSQEVYGFANAIFAIANNGYSIILLYYIIYLSQSFNNNYLFYAKGLNRYSEEMFGINYSGGLIMSSRYYYIISYAFILPGISKSRGFYIGLSSRSRIMS
jgi:hypothetical protein